MIITIDENLCDRIINSYCDFTGAIYEYEINETGQEYHRLNHYESDEVYPSKESLIKDTILNICCIVESMED